MTGNTFDLYVSAFKITTATFSKYFRMNSQVFIDVGQPFNAGLASLTRLEMIY